MLEYGCGVGRWLPFFQQYGCRWSGVDISQEMLELATTRAPSIDSANISNRSIGRTLYQWHVRAPLVDPAARIGIKETLKKLLRGAPANPADYRVQPYRRPKWLRIMVAVAVKGR